MESSLIPQSCNDNKFIKLKFSISKYWLMLPDSAKPFQRTGQLTIVTIHLSSLSLHVSQFHGATYCCMRVLTDAPIFCKTISKDWPINYWHYPPFIVTFSSDIRSHTLIWCGFLLDDNLMESALNYYVIELHNLICVILFHNRSIAILLQLFRPEKFVLNCKSLLNCKSAKQSLQ